MTKTARQKRKLGLLLIFALATIAAYFVPLARLGRSIGMDWSYFNSLSLVTRSNILSYGTFPLHDPWVLGGTDILSNPQSRVFSPTLLLDLIFSPHVANIISLMIYSFFGLLGAYRLLRRVRISHVPAAACAILFINCSWFGLHFSEGHIPYGTQQLLPWVLYFTLSIHRAKSFFMLSMLLALLLVDGGIYSFIFSLMLIGTSLLVGLGQPRRFIRTFLNKRTLFLRLASAAAFCLIASAKIVPVLLFFVERQPSIDRTSIPWDGILSIFFLPFQDPLMPAIFSQNGYRFHEFGCYLGIVALGILAWHKLTHPKSLWQQGQYLLLLFFWFWVASGWGGSINPWTIFQELPVVNNAHLQSRTFILMFLFFIILLAKSLDHINHKNTKACLIIVGLLIGESVLVRNHPFLRMYDGQSYAAPEAKLITSRQISTTVANGAKPFHYFSGLGSVSTYEPAAPPTAVLASNDPRYRGEVYSLGGHGQAWIESFTPGRIRLKYTANSTTDRVLAQAQPFTVAINSNYLRGWNVAKGSARVFETDDGLIGAQLGGQGGYEDGHKDGSVELVYSPDYLPFIVSAYLLGLSSMLAIYRVYFRKQKHQNTDEQQAPEFDYSGIPLGYYDQVIKTNQQPVRRLWHLAKFERILDCLPKRPDLAILDIGCFSGTFLGMIPRERCARQLGVDILGGQINYATEHYGTDFREFRHIDNVSSVLAITGNFDCITCIEVIEHLKYTDISALLGAAAAKLSPGGQLILSTPNYSSAWPFIELILNNFSEISYKEQHLAKFNYFTCLDRLRHIYPDFDTEFEVKVITTSHFIAPFLAAISFDRARALARRIPHGLWKFPFGNLIIVVLQKRQTDAQTNAQDHTIEQKAA